MANPTPSTFKVPAITHQDRDEAATKTAYYAYLAAQGLSA
jgi:hypothetical protein